MSKQEKKQQDPAVEAVPVEEPQAQTEPQAAPQQEAAADPLLEELEKLRKQMDEKEEQYLRLAAEYDNFRKRSQKEKEGLYQGAKSDAVAAFLPVYDNLDRALKQETADEAYKKGVEMTMTGLKDILSKLGVEEIPALGETFDPNLHNAVMHVEEEGAGENTIVEVFQTGFKAGDKVIRFAMVKVAN